MIGLRKDQNNYREVPSCIYILFSRDICSTQVSFIRRNSFYDGRQSAKSEQYRWHLDIYIPLQICLQAQIADFIFRTLNIQLEESFKIVFVHFVCLSQSIPFHSNAGLGITPSTTTALPVLYKSVLNLILKQLQPAYVNWLLLQAVLYLCFPAKIEHGSMLSCATSQNSHLYLRTRERKMKRRVSSTPVLLSSNQDIAWATYTSTTYIYFCYFCFF